MRIPTIGVFIPFLGGFYMGEVTSYLRFWAKLNAFNIIFIRTKSFGTYDLNVSINHCNGFISVLNAVSPSLLEEIPDTKPFVVIGSDDYNKYPVERIFSDHKSGVNQVVDHLHKLGHRKIGYLGDFNIIDLKLRHDHYKKRLEELGLEYNSEYVFNANEPSMEGGRQASQIFLEKKLGMTALIGSADLMTLGFIQGIAAAGVRCPEEIAVTGYEATSLARSFNPSITSINQHMLTVCEHAVNRIQARLNGDARKSDPIFVEQELYIGRSCGAPEHMQMNDIEYRNRRSNNIAAFQPQTSTYKNNESLVAFTKAGFESLSSASFLFGPFFTEGYRAKWEEDNFELKLKLDSHFSHFGPLALESEFVFTAHNYPPLTPTNKNVPYVLIVLPISADAIDWEVISLFDDSTNSVSIDNFAMFYNYLDMISFALERDAFSTITRQKEEESAALTKQLLELNSTLEARVMARTKEYEDLNKYLHIKNEELEKASQYKSDFIANMSHELRTPLNSILGFSKRLQRIMGENIDARSSQAVTTIERNAERLNELISDVLDVSKIEAGFLTINLSEVDLFEIAQDVVNDFKSIAEEKQLELRLAPDNSSGEFLLNVDPLRCTQIITNLVSNAIKYTTKGSVLIKIAKGRHEKIGSCYSVEVVDTGIGIPNSAMQSLFEKFGRMKKHERSDIAGTGLGLSIVHELIKLHHGEIQVKSKEGEGSHFTVFFPESIN